MHLLVHALSCTNLSGRQVLCGHLTEMLRRADASHRFALLHHAGNVDLISMLEQAWGGPLPERLVVREASPSTAHWSGRVVHDQLSLPSLIRQLKVDAVLTLSGTYLRDLPCPQFTLALNPWAFVTCAHRTVSARLKAALQRHAYRRAVKRADGIGYGSAYMMDLYRKNAGAEERRGAVVYPAFGQTEIGEMEAVANSAIKRESCSVVCVSLMARHKNIETLLRVIKSVREQHDCPATLRLVGGWPDASYRTEIEAEIERLNLSGVVEITGHVSREVLLQSCARAKVYALLSRSESFCIPAVEAQWMGTPVVAATGCAAPEVCGEGGRYVAPADVEGASDALIKLLTDAEEWSRRSRLARENARRFQYAKTTPVLMELMGLA